MKRVFAFLLMMIVPTVVGAETISQFMEQNYLGDMEYLWLEGKLNLEAGQTICRRMLNIAASRNIQIVIGDYKPTIEYCDIDNLDVVMFLTLESAKQLNINSVKYSCKEKLAFNYMNAELHNYFIKRRNIFEVEGSADIVCSEDVEYCIANQKVTDYGVLVFCAPFSGLECRTEYDENGNRIDATDNKRFYSRLITIRSDVIRTLGDFDKDCKPLWK